MAVAVSPTPAVSSTPPAWQIWTGLWIVYLVWGSTYLAIRIMVETVPPLLGAGVRFALAGAAMIAVLALRGGLRRVRLTRREALSAAVVGTLLMGANAVVCVAEVQVPSSMAALLIATVPLWVVAYRSGLGERVPRGGVLAVLAGFGGVSVLLLPGEQTGGASLLGLLAVVGSAAGWAAGSVAAPRVQLPRDPLVSTGWQMLIGGLVCGLAGALVGELGRVEPGAFSSRSLLALAYLIAFGSWLAFTAYAWLLQNAPLSKVATYAYVNPVVAIALGLVVLDEAVTAVTVAGAAIIVASVAAVVRAESSRAKSVR